MIVAWNATLPVLLLVNTTLKLPLQRRVGGGEGGGGGQCVKLWQAAACVSSLLLLQDVQGPDDGRGVRAVGFRHDQDRLTIVLGVITSVVPTNVILQ